MAGDDVSQPTAGPRIDDSGPHLLLETGLVGGSDGRALLHPTSPYYGLALIAWRSQDTWSIPDRIAFFRDLERLWPERESRLEHASKTMSPEGRELAEQRARAAARALANRKPRTEIADTWGVKVDSLRRSGVWARADEIRQDGGPKPLKPAPPNDSALVATVHDGVLPGPGEHAVEFAYLAANEISSNRRTTFYDVRTFLPRVYSFGEDPPSPNGLRILPTPRRRVPRPARPGTAQD